MSTRGSMKQSSSARTRTGDESAQGTPGGVDRLRAQQQTLIARAKSQRDAIRAQAEPLRAQARHASAWLKAQSAKPEPERDPRYPAVRSAYRQTREQIDLLHMRYTDLQEEVTMREQALNGQQRPRGGQASKSVSRGKREATRGAYQSPSWLHWRSVQASLREAEKQLAGQAPIMGRTTRGAQFESERAARRAALEARVAELRPEVERAWAVVQSERAVIPVQTRQESAETRQLRSLAMQERNLVSRLGQEHLTGTVRAGLESELTSVRAQREQLRPGARALTTMGVRPPRTVEQRAARNQRERENRARVTSDEREARNAARRAARAVKKTAQP